MLESRTKGFWDDVEDLRDEPPYRSAPPPMNLLTQPARGDEARFNTGLARALEWHKDY
ncbi:hypothetical protein AB0N07_46295 [Streptomyces sp. NPDC051172]|uniref:hypothetical protein n=1 Tax=Streptomyces sp. NPDC051172 TaxID=3155796 RepID=UPI0034299A10